MAKKHIAVDYQGAFDDLNKSCKIKSIEMNLNNPVNGVDLKKEDYPNAID